MLFDQNEATKKYEKSETAHFCHLSGYGYESVMDIFA